MDGSRFSQRQQAKKKTAPNPAPAADPPPFKPIDSAAAAAAQKTLGMDPGLSKAAKKRKAKEAASQAAKAPKQPPAKTKPKSLKRKAAPAEDGASDDGDALERGGAAGPGGGRGKRVALPD